MEDQACGLQLGCRDADEDGEDDGDEVELTLASVAFVASVAIRCHDTLLGC